MKMWGFTLVELLAVIVILAIIALIATPVVLSIIDDAKESAMLRSAEFYLDAVENAVMRENMNNGGNFKPSECSISNGNMTCGSTNVEVEVDGEVPSTGSIVFENGKITQVTLNYESETILKDSSGALVFENKIDDVCILVDGIANTVGAKYTCDLGAGGKNFYVLKAGTADAAVTLILEGNYDTTALAYCDQNGANWGSNICAADGLTKKLDEILSVWTKLERYQIGLPSASDIVIADGKSEDAYLNSPELSKSWLYSYDSSVWGDAVQGYWTTTAFLNDSSRVWYVHSSGKLSSYGYVTDHWKRGVRPVIYLKM